MPRPKAYDEEKVLDAAMLCFWHKGYCATSMKDLQGCTGLTAGSLYNSFGSKDSLFLQVLDHYIEKIVAGRVERFLSSGDAIDGIERYFYDSFQARVDKDCIGCLLVNTSTELGPHDEAVRAKLAVGSRVSAEGIKKALIRAQAAGQLPINLDPKIQAAHLGFLMSGMLVTSKYTDSDRWMNTAMGVVRSLIH